MNNSGENLSERELEILKLVATGVTNKEIANELVISTNTVKVHLKNIFSKIGVNSRTEAAMYAVNTGIVSTTQTGEPVSESSIEVTQRSDINWVMVAAVLFPFAILLIGVIVSLFLNSPLQNQNSITASPEIKWEILTPLSVSRSSMGIAVVENNIYSIGGETEDGVSNRVEQYNPQENLWTELAPKPTAVTDIGAVVIGNLIYVPGGELDNGEVNDQLEIYDPRTNRWSTGSNMPHPVSAYAIEAFEGKLYIFGGWDGETYLDQVWEYDPGEDSWSEKTPLSSPRKYANAVSTSANIYVIGGLNGDQSLDNVEVYTPNLDNNIDDPWEAAPHIPEGRNGLGAVEITDVIYVIGGENESGSALPPLSYSIQEKNWQMFTHENNQLWTHMGLTALGPRIYAIGGKINAKLSAQAFAYQALYITVLPIVP